MNADDWDRMAADVLGDLRESHQIRSRRTITPLDATRVEINGRCLINFASNDYLGLAHHPEVISAACDAISRYGTGSAASPLITGYGPAHEAAEARIAQWKGTQRAILLPSGYQANHAAIETIAAIAHQNERTAWFLLDKLCHASLIDAVRSVEAEFHTFGHNRLSRLADLLSRREKQQIPVVVTESIFSMDGDAADLRGLARLKREHGFFVLLDEAHASGVYGENGNGLPVELGLPKLADAAVVTLSKALGCSGGAVCASDAFAQVLVNRARAYIFSTSVPPSTAAGAVGAINVMAQEPSRQQRVRQLAVRVRNELDGQGFALPPGDSPIIPIILGNETAALKAAAHMYENGILCLAIRPPSVPRGASRLRITLSSEHSDQDVAALLAATALLPRPESAAPVTPAD